MNVQSVILLVIIIIAFILAIAYMVRNGTMGGCGSRDCDGNCERCTRMTGHKAKDKTRKKV